ncbi:hypothetical protein BDA99DRAFT_535279 [Phascolomyces articulosus]|uniref:Uncharacterized protein n=1 Tax=Phascolomyces articulosus TaxID=60185 RepID=A0AAD5PGI4_9FUNG|nr:hypothetical protein BDA99DRAFT_535279 [Phascolomyces articulosus]
MWISALALALTPFVGACCTVYQVDHIKWSTNDDYIFLHSGIYMVWPENQSCSQLQKKHKEDSLSYGLNCLLPDLRDSNSNLFYTGELIDVTLGGNTLIIVLEVKIQVFLMVSQSDKKFS